VLTTRLGWFGAVAYALPILEVWLLTRLSERGASALLVVLQGLWVVALLAVLHRCVRGSRAYRQAVADAEREAAAREREHGHLTRDHAALPAVAPRAARRAGSPRPTSERRRSHR
jgi:hypothetical protein